MQGFRFSWTELPSWVDWVEQWYNSESLGRDKHSWLLMILHFIHCFSIKLSSVSLIRYRLPVLKPLPCHISYFLILMLSRTLLLVFQVLFHWTSQNLGNLPSMTSYYNAIIYQCIRNINQISIFNRRKFVGGSQTLPIWNW